MMAVFMCHHGINIDTKPSFMEGWRRWQTAIGKVPSKPELAEEAFSYLKDKVKACTNPECAIRNCEVKDGIPQANFMQLRTCSANTDFKQALAEALVQILDAHPRRVNSVVVVLEETQKSLEMNPPPTAMHMEDIPHP